MRVKDYKCDICKESIVNTDEFIGFAMKTDASEYYPVPVEKAKNHICRQCLDDLSKFHKKWSEKDTMSAAQLHAWELSW